MQAIIPLLLIIFFAGFTQGLSGFGSIMISLPLLAIFLDIKTVIPLISLYALIINAILLVQLYPSLQVKRLAVMLVATVPGIPTGVYLLKNIPAGILQLVLGIVLILFAAYALFLRLPRLKTGRKSEIAAGFLAGCLGGSIGANGPPIIIYTAVQPWAKDEIKSTLAGYFFTAGIGISTTHAVSGLITGKVLAYFLAGLVSLILGVFAGSRMYGKISETAYKKAISILILLLGIVMVLKFAAG
ncbi:MAG: sulfite exporter TauE/SafE family protein [Desulfonatronovibrionaceae bacterium]